MLLCMQLPMQGMEGNVGKQEESLFNQTKIDNIFISIQA